MKLALCFSLVLMIVLGQTFGQRKKKTDPCAESQNQADMNNCYGNEYKTADAILNQTYRRLVSMLNDEEKSQLKEVETAWLKYRDANCDFVADQYKGGTLRPTIHAICLARVTSNRTAELKTQIEDRTH
ncbi:MAG TPA: lysozyme inhibitor LprI family protein [Pyrinomonadaceae bacterium]|jgi:uncharacterized protein YecT (DUF1311 family)